MGFIKFQDWLKKRLNEVDPNVANSPSQVTAPTDPKEIERRDAVNKITSDMMKTNKQLVPGNTKQDMVANAMRTNPQIAKLDTDTQQDVTNFFLKPQTNQPQ